jgi:hypothetical protein
MTPHAAASAAMRCAQGFAGAVFRVPICRSKPTRRKGVDPAYMLDRPRLKKFRKYAPQVFKNVRYFVARSGAPWPSSQRRPAARSSRLSQNL